jgi:predicted ATP-dependent serine protease
MEATKTKPRPKVAHTYGAKDITRWKFEEHNLPEPYASHLGILPKRFTMYVDGDPGHGKTEYQIQVAKVLAKHFGKVRVNNVEQGKHKQIKESIVRNEIEALPAGKFAYCSIKDFNKYIEQLKRPNSGSLTASASFR